MSAAVIEIDPSVADRRRRWTCRPNRHGGRPRTTASLDPLNDPSNPHAPNGSGEAYQFTDDGEAFVPGFYNPFEDDAPVRVFANGQRNAYDLVWHSNGFLYVPTNGSAGGANAPDDPSTPEFEGITNIPTRNDYLFAVEEGGYYGHPNPILGNFILNGGNPTAGNDLAEVTTYAEGTAADPNYRGFAFDFSRNVSPNGAAEFTSDVFGTNLQGALIVTQYSNPNSLIALTPGLDGNIVDNQEISRADGSVISIQDPLDVIVNPATGQMYVITFERNSAFGSSSKLILLNPAPGGVVADNTADEGNDLALSVVDATDPATVIFAVTGLDNDIVSVRVSFDGGPAQVVTLDAQNRFTVDLSGETNPVSAVLTVEDDDGNTASTPGVSFTPGDETAPQSFYDGRDFTNLDPGSTIIRLFEDPSTHEGNVTTDADGDGLNDGYDGTSYVDFGGGAGDKVSLGVTVAVAGVYDVVLRMANGSGTARPIDIKLGDQTVSIADTQTGDAFDEWAEFPFQTDARGRSEHAGLRTGRRRRWPEHRQRILHPEHAHRRAERRHRNRGRRRFPDLRGRERRSRWRSDRHRGSHAEGRFRRLRWHGGSDRHLHGVRARGLATIRWTCSMRWPPPRTARPMDVTVNGTSVGDLPFPPNSNEGETIWTPQSASLSLVAGENTIAYTAPGANGPNIDYLRVSTAPVDLFDATYAAIDGSGRIELEATDGTARPVDADTAEFYFTVAADGAYAFDLAANAGAPDGGGITLSLSADGGIPVQIDDTGFPGAGDEGEVSSFANLQAGVEYKLTVQSDAPGANDLDYLDVRVAPGDENADIEVQSLDPAFFDNRLHFSWIDNPATAKQPDRDFKENATVQISNSGTAPLDILDVGIAGPFELADPSSLDGLTLEAGESVDVEVLFDRDAYTSGNNNVTGVFSGALTLRTNDADSPITTVDLSGFWQNQDEGGWEPNVNEVWEVFGFGNEIAGLSLAGGGQNSVLNFDDVYLPAPGQEGIEVLSPYWRIADGVTEARATMIASYNGSGSATLGIHNPGNKGQDIGIATWSGLQNQTLLPLDGSSGFATGLFDNGDIPNGWNGADVFGIEMAGLSTDPTLNPTGSGAPSQAQLDNAYGDGTYTVIDGVVFDAAGNEVSDGYTVRIFQALDMDGDAIDNVFLGIMDYTGINYDYNDNMFIFEGITPVGDGGALTIAGLDAAAADDRLVFTNIDNPNNGGGIGDQEFRNVAEVTLTNSGIGDLDHHRLHPWRGGFRRLPGHRHDRHAGLGGQHHGDHRIRGLRFRRRRGGGIAQRDADCAERWVRGRPDDPAGWSGAIPVRRRRRAERRADRGGLRVFHERGTGTAEQRRHGRDRRRRGVVALSDAARQQPAGRGDPDRRLPAADQRGPAEHPRCRRRHSDGVVRAG